MAREKKVIDASVVAKWFLKEANTDKALKLREEHLTGKTTLIVPELIFLEVLNALRFRPVHGEKAIKKANNDLWDTQFHVERISPYLLEKAAQLALKHDLSMYDAIYAALSQLHGCALVTEDEKLSKLPQAVGI
jgi:predicted nucleic acid-binding protein